MRRDNTEKVKNFLIVGGMGSGKDTFATFLPIGYIHKSFAESLKNVVRLLRIHDIDSAFLIMNELFGGKHPCNMYAKLVELSQFPVTDEKDRGLLQYLGTDWARKYDKNVWVRGLKNKIKSNNLYVVTDCRFMNEFEAFPDWYSVYIDCPDDIRKERLLKRDGSFNEELLHHSSELEIKSIGRKCDFTINNSGDLDCYKDTVTTLVNYVNNKEGK